MWRQDEKLVIGEPGSRLSPGIEFTSIFFLNFPSSRMVRNKFLLFMSHQSMVFLYSSQNRLRQELILLQLPLEWKHLEDRIYFCFVTIIFSNTRNRTTQQEPLKETLNKQLLCEWDIIIIVMIIIFYISHACRHFLWISSCVVPPSLFIYLLLFLFHFILLINRLTKILKHFCVLTFSTPVVYGMMAVPLITSLENYFSRALNFFWSSRHRDIKKTKLIRHFRV